MTLWVVMACAFLPGCNKVDEPVEIIIPAEYIYVLNCGKDGSNNASLTLYDVEARKVTQRFFETQNGRRLGDTGQDLIVYGNKLFIAMFGESTIEVTDLEAKSIKQIKTEGKPRSLYAYGGKVYVTYFNGFVARIDTASLEVEAKTAVGRNPEQLAVANGKIFVANSGGLDFNTETGYDRTVSVVDIATFKEERKIEVVINPSELVADHNGNIYVVSFGNYMDVPNTLQKIHANTGVVSVLPDFNGTYLTATGNTLYTIYSLYDENWNQTVVYYAYDMTGNKVLSNRFTGDTRIDNPFQISSDAVTGDVYITASDYLNDGDVYIFDSSHRFAGKFEAGLNPMKVIKIKR
jgi:YVTN family beta-propeller protein